MNPSVVTVGPESPTSLAARLLSRNNIGSLPVRDERGSLVGVVTDRDIVLRCVAVDRSPEKTPVSEVMTQSPTAISSGADCSLAARMMARHQIRRLPVVERGRLVGMVSLGDLAVQGCHDMEAARALSEISENVIHRSDLL